MSQAGGDDSASASPNFFLTPHQQNLLFAALNANRQSVAASSGISLSSNSFSSSPMASLGNAGFLEKPYLDTYDYDLADSSFDFSLTNFNPPRPDADAPATVKSDSTENESNDKRNHPDDEDGDESLGKDSKRHESLDKAPKKNLIDEIDAKQKAIEEDLPKEQSVQCGEIWDKLQGCPKAQSGKFDLDGLCSKLTKKAKCSGNGPVVSENDFDSILKKYMGKDVSSRCVASTLGITINADAKSNGVAMS